MGNPYQSYTIEALKDEIDKVTKREKVSHLQQDKILLLALQQELDKRTVEKSMSSDARFRELFNKIRDFQDDLDKIKLEEVSGEVMLSTGVRLDNILTQMTLKVRNSVKKAKIIG